MSNLNLSIPITVEPIAMLSIGQDNITRTVIDSYNNRTEFKAKADSMDLYSENTGLSLMPGKIIFNTSELYIKNPDGQSETKFFSNDQMSYIDSDMIEAITVSVTDKIQTDDENCEVTIKKGKITAKSLKNSSYIEIGIDENSYMTLRYVNSAGQEVYQLSPNNPFSEMLNIKINN